MPGLQTYIHRNRPNNTATLTNPPTHPPPTVAAPAGIAYVTKLLQSGAGTEAAKAGAAIAALLRGPPLMHYSACVCILWSALSMSVSALYPPDALQYVCT